MPGATGFTMRLLINMKRADRSLRRTLAWQVTDSSDPHRGAFRRPDTLREDQPLTCGVLGQCASAYFHPDSAYYHSPELLDRIRLMAKYMAKVQHDDGSIDLTISNIRSAPDTGFAVRPLVKAYELLRSVDDSRTRETVSFLSAFLRKARRCLARGEVHTPNHRWVVVAAMGDIHRFFPSKELKAASERYLSEGIDVNGDGMYIHERSNSIYSWISNRALIDIAGLWRKQWILNHVRKSLDFMVYNVHPNGEVVDEYSRRQDRGTHSLLSSLAFQCYGEMALRDGDRTYASMAKWAFLVGLERGGAPAGYMPKETLVKIVSMPMDPLPTNYDAHFHRSGVARIRRGKVSATVMADNFDNFLTFRNGDAIIDSLKLRYNYWGWWHFNPKAISEQGGAYRLRDVFTGRTFRPGSKEIRLKTRFEVDVAVRKMRNGLALHISTKGPRNIVMQVDLGIRPSGTLRIGRRKYDLSRIRGPVYFERDEAILQKGEDRVLIRGGVCEHRISDGWRGFNPWERYGNRTVSLLMTPISPLDRRLEFTAG